MPIVFNSTFSGARYRHLHTKALNWLCASSKPTIKGGCMRYRATWINVGKEDEGDWRQRQRCYYSSALHHLINLPSYLHMAAVDPLQTQIHMPNGLVLSQSTPDDDDTDSGLYMYFKWRLLQSDYYWLGCCGSSFLCLPFATKICRTNRFTGSMINVEESSHPCVSRDVYLIVMGFLRNSTLNNVCYLVRLRSSDEA